MRGYGASRATLAAVLAIVLSVDAEARQDVSAAARNSCLESVEIPSSAQGQLGEDFRIGAGNIWTGEYENEQGAIEHGLSAGLSVFVRDRPAENLRLRVGPGSRFSAGGEEFRVLEVKPDGVRLCRLGVTTGRTECTRS